MNATITKTRSVMTMTKAQAIAIQERDILHYGQTYGVERVRALVKAACTAHLLPEGEHDIITINQHIPRGGALEWLIPEIREREEAIRARKLAEWEAEKARWAVLDARRAARRAKAAQ